MSEGGQVVNPVDLKSLKGPVIAIVSYLLSDGGPPDYPRPGKFYQVTIDPAALSPSGEFIRFGSCHGDEIMGWQSLEEIVIEEILAEYAEGQDLPLIEQQKAIQVFTKTVRERAEAKK